MQIDSTIIRFPLRFRAVALTLRRRLIDIMLISQVNRVARAVCRKKPVENRATNDAFPPSWNLSRSLLFRGPTMVFFFRFYNIVDSIQFFNLSYVTTLRVPSTTRKVIFNTFFVIEIPVEKNCSNDCKYLPPIMKHSKSRRFLPFVNLLYYDLTNVIYYFRNYFENSFEKNSRRTKHSIVFNSSAFRVYYEEEKRLRAVKSNFKHFSLADFLGG